jgi:hypothetical protein
MYFSWKGTAFQSCPVLKWPHGVKHGARRVLATVVSLNNHCSGYQLRRVSTLLLRNAAFIDDLPAMGSAYQPLGVLAIARTLRILHLPLPAAMYVHKHLASIHCKAEQPFMRPTANLTGQRRS